MKHNPVLRVVAKIAIPIIMLTGLYVQFHGDFGPGGGFQAGVIFAAGFILYGLIFGTESLCRVVPDTVLRWLIAAGVFLFAGVGYLPLFAGAPYLDYDALATDPLVGQHIGILLVEFGVGVTVFAVMTAVFIAFSARED